MPERPARRPAGTRWAVRALGWAVTAVLLATGAAVLGDRWDEVQAAGGLPGAGAVALAVGVNAGANVVLVQAWRAVLATAGVVLGTRAATWVWAVSQLARYTVGAAQVGGRAVAGRRYGVTATAGVVSTLVEVAWQVSITATMVLATAPWWLPGADELTWLAVAGALPAAVLGVGLLAPAALLAGLGRLAGWGPLDRLLRGRLSSAVGRVRLGRRDAARLTVRYLANALLRLAAFLVLFGAVGGDLRTDGLRAVGAYALGQLVGRLAIFAPGGLGPREGVTALAVTPAVGAGPAVVLVAAVRLCEVLGEALFLAGARAVRPPRA